MRRTSGASASNLTVNYGLRYERINPFTEAEDRLNGFIPGMQSTVRPDAPRGLVFPGDPGIGEGIAHSYNAYMPRVGVAWDPSGDGIWSVRASYGLLLRPVPERRRHGLAGGDQRRAVGAVRPVQRRRPQLPEPLPWAPVADRDSVRPAGDGVRARRRRQAAVRAGLEHRRPARAASIAISSKRDTSARRADICRATSKSNPAVFGPGATAQNADRRRHLRQLSGRRQRLRLLDRRHAAKHHELVVPRRSVQPVAPIRRRRRLQRLLLVFARERLPVGDEPLRRGGQAAGRRERSGAEPVRSRGRIRTVALRRAASLRRQRQLDGPGAGRRRRRRSS